VRVLEGLQQSRDRGSPHVDPGRPVLEAEELPLGFRERVVAFPPSVHDRLGGEVEQLLPAGAGDLVQVQQLRHLVGLLAHAGPFVAADFRR
jgi:hypothetical protein